MGGAIFTMAPWGACLTILLEPLYGPGVGGVDPGSAALRPVDTPVAVKMGFLALLGESNGDFVFASISCSIVRTFAESLAFSRASTSKVEYKL